MNSAAVGHSGAQTHGDVARNFQCHGNFLDKDPHLDQTTQNAPKMREAAALKGSDCAGCFRDSGGEGLGDQSGYNTKCLYEALWLLETVRDGALLLGEERGFVFIGSLECVEDCGHLLY